MTIRGAAAIAALGKGIGGNFDDEANAHWEKLFTRLLAIGKDDDVSQVTFSKQKIAGYKLNIAMLLSPLSSPIQVSANPTNKKNAPLRVTFNPSHQPSDWPHLLNELWAEFDFSTIPFPALLVDAKVTRLDVAFDVVGLRPCDVFVTHQKIAKIWTASSMSGGIETQQIYLKSGKMKSPQVSPKKRADLIVYDKRKELLARGLEPLFGEAEHTRIEFSRNTQCSLKNLPSAKWPAHGWRIGRVTPDVFTFDKADKLMFFDSVRVRGSKDASALQSHVFSTVDYEKDFANLVPADILSEEVFWSGWKPALEQSGLSHWIHWATAPLNELFEAGT